VNVLVAVNENDKAATAGTPPPSSTVSRRCCWRMVPPMRPIWPSRWPRDRGLAPGYEAFVAPRPEPFKNVMRGLQR